MPNFLGSDPNAEVTLTCSNASKTFPKFYVADRKNIGTATELTCVDRMRFTDQMIGLFDNYYYQTGNDGKPILIRESSYDENNEILTTSVIEAIATQCGFSSWSFSHAGIDKLTKDMTYKRKCSEILDLIATACMGYWFVNKSEELIFKAFGTSAYMGGITSSKHTKLNIGGTKGPITYLKMTGNNNEFTGGNETTSGTAILRVNTPLATNDLCGANITQIERYTYQAWNVDRALINFVPSAGDCEIMFAEDNTARICNYGTVYLSATGVYFSGGRNDVNESAFDYSGALSDSINKRVAISERFGNMKLNGDTLICFVNKNEG